MRNFINRLGNIFMKPLLRSPLHFFASGSIMLVTFTGRKSGRVYTTPVEYQRDGEMVAFFTQRARVWWKNLRDGAAVTLRIRGQDHPAQAVDFITDEQAIVQSLQKLHPSMPDARAAAAARTSVMIRLQLQN